VCLCACVCVCDTCVHGVLVCVGVVCVLSCVLVRVCV